jgi:diketogulonate reductase-like aldo/keto reductase
MPIIDQPTVTLNDGNVMPQLGLGVWRAKDGQEVENAVRTALLEGYRLIDTAAVYQNEAGVGAGIRASGVPREEIFVTTKLWNSDQGTDTVRPALESSLERLGLDYVDLYLIHWPMPAKDSYLETWLEFEKLKDADLTRSIGVSNFHIEHLEKLKQSSGTVPAVNQIELHPYLSQSELREYGEEAGIHIESWSPIGGSGGSVLADEKIAAIAEAHSKTAAQIVIRWHLQSDLIVIPKSVHDERIKENFDVFDFELSSDEMKTIDSLNKNERQGPNPDTMNNS